MKKLTAKQEWALEQIKQLQYSEIYLRLQSAKRLVYPIAHTLQLSQVPTTAM